MTMRRSSGDWRFAATALFLVAGSAWGVSRALSLRNAQIARLIDVLDVALAGNVVSQRALREARQR